MRLCRVLHVYAFKPVSVNKYHVQCVKKMPRTPPPHDNYGWKIITMLWGHRIQQQGSCSTVHPRMWIPTIFQLDAPSVYNSTAKILRVVFYGNQFFLPLAQCWHNFLNFLNSLLPCHFSILKNQKNLKNRMSEIWEKFLVCTPLHPVLGCKLVLWCNIFCFYFLLIL